MNVSIFFLDVLLVIWSPCWRDCSQPCLCFTFITNQPLFHLLFSSHPSNPLLLHSPSTSLLFSNGPHPPPLSPHCTPSYKAPLLSPSLPLSGLFLTAYLFPMESFSPGIRYAFRHMLFLTLHPYHTLLLPFPIRQNRKYQVSSSQPLAPWVLPLGSNRTFVLSATNHDNPLIFLSLSGWFLVLPLHSASP